MKLQLFVYDLRVAGAVEKLVRDVGEATARDIQAQTGEGLFVVAGRDDVFSHMASTPDEATVLEALAAALAEVARMGEGPGGLRFMGHVGPQLDAKFRAMISDHHRRQHRGPGVSARVN